jgi:uncharacterized protein YigE (DUF2233 family)
MTYRTILHKLPNIRGWLAILVFLLAACEAAQPAARPATPQPAPTRPIPTLFPTGVVATAPSLPPPVAAHPDDTGWLPGGAGVELRRLRVPGADGRPAFPVVVVRLDPAQVRLRVAYTPERPRALRTWFDETRPTLAINGGFFTEDYHSTALVISDGAPSGASYEGFGGMLAVAPDGGVALRALRDQPYDPAEPLAQAMQSFPMLVFPGGEVAPIEEDGKRARRSAVALDRAGRLLLIASSTSGFTLRGLADWLATSDLDVDRALNLDGGSSTGLFLNSGGLNEQIDSFGPLPLVLLVEEKT